MTAENPWDLLTRELDAWAEAGRRANLWLRDDDATRDGPRLRQLIRIMNDAPLSLAVIPKNLDPSLPALLRNHPNVAVLQHGYAHVSHAAEGEKKSEFPAGRDGVAVIADLKAGRGILEKQLGFAFRPVLAPPWNRIADTHRAALAPAGLFFLSTYGDPEAPSADPAVTDTQVDPIFWRGHRGYLGDEPVLDRLRRHLTTRRLAGAGAAIDRPTGVMTHHIVHDDGCWEFLSRLVALVGDHPAAGWTDPFATEGRAK
ncbi:MAG: hypothetical protein RIM72_13710 [Alphaproteobacteria bacterium]